MLITILLSLLAAPAGAATLADFCHDPYAAVCGPKGEAEQAREAKVAQIKERIATRARERIAQGGLSEAAYTAALMHELRKELGEAMRAANFHFERIRGALADSVERLRDLAPDEATSMRRNLADVAFVDATTLLEGIGEDKELIADIRKDCGDDGMIDNAFAFTYQDRRFVVLCPGSAIAALGPDDRLLSARELALSGVLWLLGHETGHVIDAADHPLMYAKLQGCIDSNYARQLKEQRALPYMSEISADYWGSEALAAYLSSLKSGERKLRALQESLEFLCGTEDDGSHASGRFRIENLVRRNPRIHEAVGCEGPADDAGAAGATCTLRGEWAERFW